MSKVTVKLDVGRDNGPRIAEAGSKFFNVVFRDVIRQTSAKKQEELVGRLRSRVNQVIGIQLREMGRVLTSSGLLIGRDIRQNPPIIPAVAGPDLWRLPGPVRPGKGPIRPTGYDFTSVGWKPWSPAYESAKRKKFPGRWRGWFLATGALQDELRASSMFTTGGLGRQIQVIINRKGALKDSDIERLGKGLSASQRGVGGEDGAAGVRSRTGRLKLFDIRLRIFTDFTARELPFLASGDIYDVNSGGAVLEKLTISASARRKLGPPTKRVGSSEVVMGDNYRPLFEPLLTFWMAQRIPAAVAKALYEQSGRRS